MKSFTGCYDQNIVIRVKALACVNRIIPAIIFFEIALALIVSGLKMCKTGAIKTRKSNDVAGNENKVILCNKCFGSYMQ